VSTDYSLLVDDLRRHLTDIKEHNFEGFGWDRALKEEAFKVCFDYATPVAERVLGEINDRLLDGTGTVTTLTPHDDGHGGLVGTWELNWPIMEGTVDRTTEEALPPARIAVALPTGLGHPHLAVLRPVSFEGPTGAIPEVGPDVLLAWPFQATSEADAEHLEPIFWVVAMGEVHERTARSKIGPYQIVTEFSKPERWGKGSMTPVA
jgi:hypothetical protein